MILICNLFSKVQALSSHPKSFKIFYFHYVFSFRFLIMFFYNLWIFLKDLTGNGLTCPSFLVSRFDLRISEPSTDELASQPTSPILGLKPESGTMGRPTCHAYTEQRATVELAPNYLKTNAWLVKNMRKILSRGFSGLQKPNILVRSADAKISLLIFL